MSPQKIKFDSVFVSDLQVGPAHYITELVLSNKIDYRIKCGSKVERPKCAFWRKEVLSKNPTFKELSKDYLLELTYIIDLLKTFSPNVIIQYIKEKGIRTFRYIPLDKQRATIYNIWKAECKYQKELRAALKKAKNIEVGETKVQNRQTKKTKLTGII